METVIYLQTVSLGKISAELEEHYPFNVPVIRSLPPIEFTAPVTFLVGENGSGKSTFLELLALAAGSIAVGSDELERDKTLESVRQLAKSLKLSWRKRTRKGFFLRAEDYFGFAKRLARIREDLQQDLRDMDVEYKDRSAYARGLAFSPLLGELRALDEEYDGDLNERSHGESFFTFFQARFVPDGLYLVDEPEAALSPLRQLGFLSMIKEMVENKRAQFIIATHSPILMAFPGATILSFDKNPVQAVQYDDLEHVTLTRDFLNNRNSYLRHL